MYINAKANTCDMLEFPAAFCRINRFYQIAHYNEDIVVDFVIDTDNDRIYKSSY
ncbi:hypothetical protein NCCP28_01820 [Niallia sp. NCCP-28]|nr:hypothetical protein NCCP28_01820 [Niallia sp. NCCP-28]